MTANIKQNLIRFLGGVAGVRPSIWMMALAPFMILFESGSGYTVMSIRPFLALYGLFYYLEYATGQHKPYITKMHFYIIAYLAAITLTTLFIPTYNNSYFSTLFIGVIFFLLLSQCLRRQEIALLANSYVAVTTCISVLLFIQHQSYQGFDGRRTISFMGSQGQDPNFLAAIMLMPIVILAYRTLMHKRLAWRLCYGALFLFNTAALVYLGSRSAVMLLGIACAILGVWYLLQNKVPIKTLFIVGAVLIAAAAVGLIILPTELKTRFFGYNYMADTGNQDRLSVWIACIKMFTHAPFIGVGLGGVLVNSLRFGARRTMLAHNTYLEVLASGGLLSFVPFIMMCTHLLRRCLKMAYLPLCAMLFTGFASAFFINAQDVPFFGRTLFFVFFIVEYLEHHKEEGVRLEDVLL
ncbi:MAG: O-antigen ligase family protein [Oscillospiraceae bacterium]|nr:O-antigen ligase family protein [Oscillospiraceae bacterium]